jgi:hypothetical protein
MTCITRFFVLRRERAQRPRERARRHRAEFEAQEVYVLSVEMRPFGIEKRRLTHHRKRPAKKCCPAEFDCSETSAEVEWQSIFKDAINIIDMISTIASKLKLTFNAYPEMPDRQAGDRGERFYDRKIIQPQDPPATTGRRPRRVASLSSAGRFP